jgi:hypothetical protein
MSLLITQAFYSLTAFPRPRRDPVAAGALICTLAMAGVVGSATAEPFNPSHLASEQLSWVHQICRAVVGIPDGTQLSSDCVADLSDAAAALSQSRTDGPALNRTELSALTPPPKSYYSATFDEVRRRERVACMRLGYDPISSGFAKCVANLNSALSASDRAMQ